MRKSSTLSLLSNLTSGFDMTYKPLFFILSHYVYYSYHDEVEYRKLQDRNDVIVRVLNCERSTDTLHSVHIERKTCTGHTWWVVICIVCIILHS